MTAILTSILAKPIIKKYGKYLAGIIAIIIISIILIIAFNNYKQSLIQIGYEKAEQDFRDIVRKNDEANRLKEQRLDNEIKDFAQKQRDIEKQNIKEAQTIAAEINEKLKNLDKRCVIDADILELRNKLRP